MEYLGRIECGWTGVVCEPNYTYDLVFNLACMSKDKRTKIFQV